MFMCAFRYSETPAHLSDVTELDSRVFAPSFREPVENFSIVQDSVKTILQDKLMSLSAIVQHS